MLDNLRRSSTPPHDLFGIIAHVRNRWRMKLALRGAVALLAAAFGLFVLAAYGLEAVKFTTTSIIIARVALVVGLIAAVLWFVVRPLRRQVTDEQVALYLEEHEPALQATLLSASAASLSLPCLWFSSVPRSCVTPRRRCSSFPAASKRPCRIASRSPPATRWCRRAPTRS
jgi:hypothetical protein